MRLSSQFDLVLKVGILVLTLLTAAMIYLYFKVDGVLHATRQEMIEMIVHRYQMQMENAAKMLSKEVTGDFVTALAKDSALRHDLESRLHYYKTHEIDNLFVIYQDAKGHYRYLLDSEPDVEKKAMFRQRFEPVSNIWEMTFHDKRDEIERHLKNGRLWVTLASPIVRKDRVIAVVGSDLSASIRSDVEKSFTQIKSIMMGVAIVILVLLLFGYLQIYYYFKGCSKSFFDPLTGVYNRKFLYEVLANGRFKEYRILMYDIDHFKNINDEYGHEVGDKVLQLVTARVKKQLREEDILIRYGGEEFVIFLHTTNPSEAMDVALRLKKSIETSPFVIEENIVSVTISVGIYTDVAKAANVDDAIEKADEQLYCAKREGRNRVCVNWKVVW